MRPPSNTRKWSVSSLPSRWGISVWRWRWLPPESTIGPSPSGTRSSDWCRACGRRVGLAEALLASGDPAGAADQCRQVLDQEPGAIKAIVLLGEALARAGKVEDAIVQLQRAVELDPRNASAHYQLALVSINLGRPADALDHLDAAVRLEPDNVLFLRQTAWLLATSPDSSVRDGARAVELAKKAVELTKDKDLRALDVLAAALAESGQFPAAVDVAWRASIAAMAQDEAALSDALGERVRLYRQGLPYRQSPGEAKQLKSDVDRASSEARP